MNVCFTVDYNSILQIVSISMSHMHLVLTSVPSKSSLVFQLAGVTALTLLLNFCQVIGIRASHILLNSYGKSCVLWEILWESYGNSHRNPVGMGWEWELKFHSHDNPESSGEIRVF